MEIYCPYYLKYYNKDFGFEDWQNLCNPDVFLLKNECTKVTSERLWIG